MHCYRLHFTAPFHIDSRGDAFHERSDTFIHSDTLSAALLSAWALLEPDQAEQRAATPPFKLSSAFPFYQERYFLPRAYNTFAVKLPAGQLRQAKVLKKIQWLEIGLWKKSFQADWTDRFRPERDAAPGVLAFSYPAPEGVSRLWAEEERPRLAIDRISNTSSQGQLFHLSRVWFAEGAGLYFFATFAGDQERKAFEAALRLLGDSGIGSDRSNGNGFFEWQAGALPDVAWADEGPCVALSLVSPAANDCQAGWLDGAAYKMLSRGGWIGQSGQRKPRLRMFAEGSVFQRPLQGQVLDISTDHAPNPVYRDGRGFFIKAG